MEVRHDDWLLLGDRFDMIFSWYVQIGTLSWFVDERWQHDWWLRAECTLSNMHCTIEFVARLEVWFVSDVTGVWTLATSSVRRNRCCIRIGECRVNDTRARRSCGDAIAYWRCAFHLQFHFVFVYRICIWRDSLTQQSWPMWHAVARIFVLLLIRACPRVCFVFVIWMRPP